jgi:O-6-methylguanine DNA methyltransferase
MHRARNQAIFKTPFGWAGVAASEQGICGIVLPRKEKKAVERELKAFLPQHETGLQTNTLKKAVRRLTDYFSSKRVVFDLPLDTRLYTSFQQAVWKATAEIPCGETRSYAWIAKKIKRPKAARAVGQALGANPLAIIIPCHRVISSSGSLGGYAGGLVLKQALLELEQK